MGVSIAIDGYADYFPFAHEAGFNFPKKRVLEFVKDVLSGDQDKIFHNAMYDVGWLKKEGVEVKGRVIDTMVVAPLVNENMYWYTLNSLGMEYLQEGKSEAELRQAAEEWGIDPKAEMWRLPSSYVGTYATQDAALTLKLWNHFKIHLEEQNLWNIFNLETDLFPVLFNMKMTGVRVDLERADKLKKQLLAKEKKDVKRSGKGFRY